MLTTLLEVVGAVTFVAGLACLVLVFWPALWPLTFVLFGAGLVGISAFISLWGRFGGKK